MYYKIFTSLFGGTEYADLDRDLNPAPLEQTPHH